MLPTRRRLSPQPRRVIADGREDGRLPQPHHTAMASLILFARVMLRPLAAEPGRAMLTVFAVALGVSVVVAIELAGEAATGSFRSSMESLVGDVDFEIGAVGGVDETLLADLAMLPYPLAVSPRIEEAAVMLPERKTVSLLGLDLIGDISIESALWRESFDVAAITGGKAVWVGSTLGLARGDTLRLGVHDQEHAFVVEGVLPDDELSEQIRKDLVVMDIALAQRVVGRAGRLDRIEIRVPKQEIEGGWQALLTRSIPAGVALRPQGAGTRENQKMLSAFRWNLRVLSYISLVVGAFLIYYTISVSVVRRRTEIGILRALGTTRRGVLAAVLLEAGFFGLLGTLLGFAMGRVLADGAVELMARTVEALYVSSAPGDILFTPWAVAVGLAAGIGVTLLAALGPAREAARIPPTEAMAAGRRHYEARLRLRREVGWAFALAAAAWAASQLPPVDGKPLAGYLAALLLIAAAAFATPALVTVMVRAAAPVVRRLLGVEGLLASRGLVGSLARTAVLVSTLATAVAMMASVAIMVGSFRETVDLWLDNRLQADLYIRPAGPGGAGNHPTMDVSIADRIEQLDGVAAVDRFRAYAISYDGRPATLGAGETQVFSRSSRLRFLSGDPDEIMRRLPQGDFVVVSEPFAEKHSLARGNAVRLPLAAAWFLSRFSESTTTMRTSGAI